MQLVDHTKYGNDQQLRISKPDTSTIDRRNDIMNMVLNLRNSLGDKQSNMIIKILSNSDNTIESIIDNDNGKIAIVINH